MVRFQQSFSRHGIARASAALPIWLSENVRFRRFVSVVRGEASRQHLAGLVFGREVRADCPKRDRYGRWLCKLRVDGRDANFAQLTAGMAWHYKAYGKDQGLFDFTGYALAELEARYRRRGLWADPRPQAPWDFRRAKREAAGGGLFGG